MHYIKATPRYHYTMVSKQMPLDLGAVEPFSRAVASVEVACLMDGHEHNGKRNGTSSP